MFKRVVSCSLVHLLLFQVGVMDVRAALLAPPRAPALSPAAGFEQQALMPIVRYFLHMVVPARAAFRKTQLPKDRKSANLVGIKGIRKNHRPNGLKRSDNGLAGKSLLAHRLISKHKFLRQALPKWAIPSIVFVVGTLWFGWVGSATAVVATAYFGLGGTSFQPGEFEVQGRRFKTELLSGKDALTAEDIRALPPTGTDADLIAYSLNHHQTSRAVVIRDLETGKLVHYAVVVSDAEIHREDAYAGANRLYLLAYSTDPDSQKLGLARVSLNVIQELAVSQGYEELSAWLEPNLGRGPTGDPAQSGALRSLRGMGGEVARLLPSDRRPASGADTTRALDHGNAALSAIHVNPDVATRRPKIDDLLRMVPFATLEVIVPLTAPTDKKDTTSVAGPPAFHISHAPMDSTQADVRRTPPRTILYGAMESPYRKRGGLGDYIRDLPAGMAKRGHDIYVVTPLYPGIELNGLKVLETKEIEIPMGDSFIRMIGKKVQVAPNLTYLFLEDPEGILFVEPYKESRKLRGLVEAIVLSQAMCLLPQAFGINVNIVQANDWQTGLAPIYMKKLYPDAFKSSRSVYTIHNAYSGDFSKLLATLTSDPVAHKLVSAGVIPPPPAPGAGAWLVNTYPLLKLPTEFIENTDQGIEWWKDYALIKGMQSSDLVTTVSEGNMDELMLPNEKGGAAFGADGVVRAMHAKGKFAGIYNGVEDDPRTDPNLSTDGYTNFWEGDPDLIAKLIQNKRALLHELNVQDGENIFTVGYIGRITSQKGIEFLVGAIERVLSRENDGRKVRFVVLGTPEDDDKFGQSMKDELQRLTKRYGDRVVYVNGYNSKLSSRIYAGIDYFVTLPWYEPGGNTAEIANKYATPVMATRVGGHKDFFDKWGGVGAEVERTVASVVQGIANAERIYRNHRSVWDALVVRSSEFHASWKKRLPLYEKAYESIIPVEPGGQADVRREIGEPLSPGEATSVIGQELFKYRRNKEGERVGPISRIIGLFLMPGLALHELFTILPAVGMLFRKEIRLRRSAIELLFGHPFDYPLRHVGAMPALWWPIRILGNVANLAAIVVAWHFGLSQGASFSVETMLWGWFFIANLVMAIGEPLLGYILGRGDLYSFLFHYDKHYPELLSREEGQRRLEIAVDEYLANANVRRVPHTAILRIDDTFRDIAERRMGRPLSDRLRRFIFGHFVLSLRQAMPGTLLAATDNPNEILVISPARRSNGFQIFTTAIENALRSQYDEWLSDGYALLQIPELPKIKQGSRRRWVAIENFCREHGIFLDADYAGGMAFAIRPRNERTGKPFTDQEMGNYLGEVLKDINSKLNLSRPLVFEHHDLAEKVAKFPPYPVSLSAIVAGIGRTDEMVYWQDVPDAKSGRPAAREYMQNVPSNDRKRRLMENLETVFQRLRVESADDLGVIAVQSPTSEGDKLDYRKAYVSPHYLSIRPNGWKDVSVDNGRAGPFIPVTTYEPAANSQTQKEAQQRADVNLRDLEARLDPAVQQTHRHWQLMRRAYQKAIHSPIPNRIKHVILSAWREEQKKWFERNVNSKLYAKGTRLDVIANPLPPASLPQPTKATADGNGMAVLGIMRQFMEELVKGKGSAHALEPGQYNLYDVMKEEMFMGVFGAGKATRSPESTQRGKFLGVMPIRRNPESPGEIPQGATLEEMLAVHGYTMADVFPNRMANGPRGGFLLLYGDALITADPQRLREFFFSHPDISEGFTLVLRRVRYEEATEWGCAAVDSMGRIRHFQEKPGEKILSGTEQDFLKIYLRDIDALPAHKMSSQEYDDQVQITKKRLTESMQVVIDRESDLAEENRQLRGVSTFDDILEKLKNDLNKRGLLIDNRYILMNTAIGVAGIGTVIRLMRLAGIAIDTDGNFVVRHAGEAPTQIQDPQGLFSRNQERLAGLLLQYKDKNDSLPKTQIKRITEELQGLQKYVNGQEDPRPLERETRAKVFTLLGVLGQRIDNISSPRYVRQYLREAISELGTYVPPFEGILRDGMQIDAMGHLVAKMASESSLPDSTLGIGISCLQEIIKKEDSAEARQAYQEALEFLTELRANCNADDKNLDNIRNELEIELATLRFQMGARDASDTLVMKNVYGAYALARWHLEMWRQLHQVSSKSGGGEAYGAQVDGQWLDTGATKNVISIYTRMSWVGKVLSAAFGFVFPNLFSAGPVGHAINSAVHGTASYSVHANALRNGSEIQTLPMFEGPFTMEEGSSLKYASVPWGNATLYRDSVMVEGVVRGKDGRSYVVYPIWQQESSPNKENTDIFFGKNLHAWLPEQQSGLDLKKIWPDSSGKSKQTLFAAKLYPGLSLPLMLAAQQGKSGEDLHAIMADELDWELFVAMPKILEWLQHKAQGPPEAWLKALAADRLFSMSDRYDHSDPDGYESRQKAIENAVTMAVKKELADRGARAGDEKIHTHEVKPITSQIFAKVINTKSMKAALGILLGFFLSLPIFSEFQPPSPHQNTSLQVLVRAA